MEVLAASTMGAFVAMVAVGALKAISVGAEMVDSNIEVASEVRFASKRISTDLVNLYRDSDVQSRRFIGTVEETEDGMLSDLIFYTVSRAKARWGQPEGDVYEVEYYLVQDEEKSLLMRRMWPNPNKDAEPGGILVVIAENIDVFEVRYFDGEEWGMEWPEEMEQLPELVEVTVAAMGRDEKGMIMQTFVVNFTRSTEAGAPGEREEGQQGQQGQQGQGQQGQQGQGQQGQQGQSQGQQRPQGQQGQGPR